MRRPFVILFLLFFFFLISPKSSFAKDYYFPQVKATYNINQDSSINVHEQRTYSFSGSFSWADIYIPLKVTRKGNVYNAQISNFNIVEAGRPAIFSSGIDQNDKFYAHWTYSALNETRTFDIFYTLTGAISGGQDFDEFYWQVIGNQWEKRTKQVEILVNFPSDIPRNQVYAFAHGPLGGQFDFEAKNSVKFSVSNLPPKQFVEVRLVFTKGYINTTTSLNKTLAQVLDEEKNYRSSNFYIQIFFKIFTVIAFLITLLWIIYWTFAWLKYGKEYKYKDIPFYIHDPPSKLQPALVEILLSQGNHVTVNSFVATLLDLARRKYLTITCRRVLKNIFLYSYVKDDYGMVFKNSSKEIQDDISLMPYEKMFLEELSYSYEPPTEEEMVDFGLKPDDLFIKLDKLKLDLKSSYLKDFWKKWEKEIKIEGETLGFLEQGSVEKNRYFLISLVGITILHLIGFFAGPYESFAIALGIVGGVGVGAVWMFYILFIFLRVTVFAKKSLPPFFTFMKRWTVAYGLEAQKWQSFKNFLKDFSNFKDTLPQQLPIWEEYLVYGAVFGETKKILAMMPKVLGEQTPNWYVGTGGGSFGASFANFSSGISQISSNVSSGLSAGAGGGFSGGGGGGGGGGGAG